MGLRNLVKTLGRFLNRCVPKRENQILFESNSDYCDNSRALYDYLRENGYGERFSFVWCVENPSAPHPAGPQGARLVSFRQKKGALSYFFAMARSRYVIFSHYAPPFVNPKCQTVVNLWHGTPLKSLKGHVPPAELFTFLLSPSDFFDPILADSFGAEKNQLIQCGYPRNDLLFAQTGALEQLGIQREKYRRVLLWMPTFRVPAGGGYQDAAATPTGLPLIETPGLLEELDQVLMEENVCLVIKLHPGQDLSGVTLRELSHIRMLTNRELDEKGVQTYHLAAMADGLLTDYSSVYFDYLLLNRPVGFIVDDMEVYQANRGFTVEDPLSLMPGEKIRTVKELYAFLRSFSRGEDPFAGERARVNRLSNRYTDGESCKRTAERIFGRKDLADGTGI